MFKSRFVNKFIAPLAVMLLTQIGARVIYEVFLLIKIAVTAEIYGYGSKLASYYFTNDLEYHKWLHGRTTLADLRYLAEVRLETIRQYQSQEN